MTNTSLHNKLSARSETTYTKILSKLVPLSPFGSTRYIFSNEVL